MRSWRTATFASSANTGADTTLVEIDVDGSSITTMIESCGSSAGRYPANEDT